MKRNYNEGFGTKKLTQQWSDEHSKSLQDITPPHSSNNFQLHHDTTKDIESHLLKATTDVLHSSLPASSLDQSHILHSSPIHAEPSIAPSSSTTATFPHSIPSSTLPHIAPLTKSSSFLDSKDTHASAVESKAHSSDHVIPATSVSVSKPHALERGASASSGLTVNTEACDVCGKRVYLTEKLSADGKIYHKSCFRCHHCNSTLKLGSYAALEQKIYCKPHFKQLFALKGYFYHFDFLRLIYCFNLLTLFYSFQEL